MRKAKWFAVTVFVKVEASEGMAMDEVNEVFARAIVQGAVDDNTHDSEGIIDNTVTSVTEVSAGALH
jgi:hypothetical protein